MKKSERELIDAVLGCEGVQNCIKNGCDTCRYKESGCNSRAVVEAVKKLKGIK